MLLVSQKSAIGQLDTDDQNPFDFGFSNNSFDNSQLNLPSETPDDT